jgi:cytochrome P450
VCWIPALGGWLVTSYALAVQVMRDPDTFTVDDPRFSTAQVVGPSMLSLDGPRHARHRAPFAGPFRAGAVQERFADAVTHETDALIDAFPADNRVELRRKFAGPLAAAIVTRVLGLEREEVDAVLGWYDAIVASVTDITAGRRPSVAGAQAFASLHARLNTVIESAGESSLLAVAAAGSALTGDELVSNAAVLLFGGIETTEGMIANAMLTLLEHPEQLALARHDAWRLDAAIEESLRMEPAAAVVDRYATADVELAGAAIAVGELVRVSIAAANRDPAVFDDPDRFDPDRFDRRLANPDRFDPDRPSTARRHVAFAHGPHVCVGVHLARLEARTALSRLLHSVPDIRLDPDRPAHVRGLVFRKPPELHVRWS